MNGDLPKLDPETLESIRRFAMAETSDTAVDGKDKPLVLMVDDHSQTDAQVRALLARLDAEGLGHRVVLVSEASMGPAIPDITHIIQAMEERNQALQLHFRSRAEPAWLTEQHNRKPTPRKRR